MRRCRACPYRQPVVGALASSFILAVAPLEAQLPDSVTARQPYRPPVIALAQPTAGAAIPQDRPVVLFRFAAGERDDPIDARSLRVLVDGADATARFQVGAAETWGALGQPGSGETEPIAVGEHRIEARICSVRGACGTAAATVLVAPSGVTAAGPPSRKARLLDLLLDAARRILLP